jgi:CubicO group peptidase (beta-lactamase class C family)
MRLSLSRLTQISTAFVLSILLIVGCGPSKETSNSVVNDTAKQRIDSTLKSLVDAGGIAGVSALIFEKNKEVYFNSFGFADLEAKTPMDRKTLVRIYSMTKPVTGVALMTLFEKGAFQLDDPLAKYAPEFANMKVYVGQDAKGNMILEEPKRPITIRDITRHTAGFATNQDTTTTYGMLLKKANVMGFENTLTQMAQKLASLPLAAHPGEVWAYGISVDVQAFLVERISGKPYAQYLQETILDPLKMNETRYVVPEADRGRFAAMYRKNEDGSLARVPDDMAYKFNYSKWPLTPGGFGLTATIDDYMRFAQMLVNEGTLDNATILKPETIQLMATNHLADSVTERMFLPSKGQVGFGIDFAVRVKPPASADENNGVVGEFFWDGFASTLFWVDPVNELTAVIFVQKIPFDNALHKKFRDAVYGAYRP